MDKKLAFQVLGIEETKEEDRIRESYLSLLKDTNPEDDPEGFKRLREAYEEALRSAAERGEDIEEEPQGEVGVWMKGVREAYRDLFLRRDAEVWRELLEDPVCVGFDTFLEAREQLLGFLSGHSFLPQTVWKLLDATFHVVDDMDALKESFHINFLRHIEYHVNTRDFLDYALFEAKENYGPENDEEVDAYITGFFEIRNKLEEGETEGVEQALTDLAGRGLYHPYEEVERLRLYIRLEESEKGKELAESLLARYPEDSYVQIWTGKIFSDAGDEEKGYQLWQAVLEREPEYYMARYFALGYLKRQEQWYQARKYVNELLRVNSRDEELLEDLKEINEKLAPLIRAAYDKGEGFEDRTKEEVPLLLGRTLYNMERFEEVLELLNQDPELSKKEENPLNLKTWTLYRLERYEEAVPVFEEYLQCLEELPEGEEKEEKKAQAHRILGICFFCMDNREAGERETRTAMEAETDERGRLDIRYYLAGRYLDFKEYEKAVEECDGILAADENYYPAYLVRQEACYYLKRAQQVVDDYYRAIALYAGYDRPYLYAAMIFYNYSQYKDAMGVIERARENKAAFSKKLRFQEAKILRMLSETPEERQRVMEILDALLSETEEEALRQQGDEAEEKDAEDQDALDRAELLFEKALVFESDEKLIDAVALVQEALKLDPEEPYYHLVLGNLLRDMEKFAEALKEYEKVEEVYHHTEFYFGMGVCHEQAGNWDRAIPYYEKAVEKEEFYRDTNHRLYRGYLDRFHRLWKKEDYDAGLRCINRQLEVTNNRPYRLWDRAYLLSDGMEIEKALADYREALEGVEGEDRRIIWENIGYIYKDDRQFEKAYEAFRQAVEAMEKKDASVKGYRGMAECMQKAGNYERAIECCRAGLAVFPDDEKLWPRLVECYEETDRLEEALAVGKEWCAQAGKTMEYYDQMSFVLLKMGKVKECFQCYEDAKKELIKKAADKEKLAKLYADWADRFESAADFASAAKFYRDASALYRDNWDRFNPELELVKNCYVAGERGEAEKHAKKALDILRERGADPEDYMTYPGYEPIRTGWMAWVELALGNKEKGRQYLERMEQIRPCACCRYQKCFESSLWQGFYYYAEGDYEKAAALLEEALRRDFDVLSAKYLLQKIRGSAGSSGLPQKPDGQTGASDPGQKRKFGARLFHRKPEK